VSGDGNLLIRARTCPRKQLRFRHRIPINHGGVGWTRAACAMTHAEARRVIWSLQKLPENETSMMMMMKMMMIMMMMMMAALHHLLPLK